MKRSMGVQVGAISIIMIFVLLCLTVFAVLTLQTAQADARLSQKAAEHNTRFYQTDAQAEELLAELDAALRECYAEATDWEDYLRAVLFSFANLFPDLTLEGDRLSFSLPMGEGQSLEALLLLLDPVEGGATFQRLEWKVVSSY